MNRPVKRADFSGPPKPYPKTYSPVKEKKPLKSKRKPTGEREMHLAIWAVRKHVSHFSGEQLGDEPKPEFFMHVLPKSIYREFRTFQKNIVLGTFDEHYMQTNMSRDLWPEDFRKEWERLENELKEIYKQKHGKK